MSLEVAAKLPYLFKKYYTAETILSIELTGNHLRTVGNDFDNVRPPQALLNFLFSTPGMSHKEVWRFIRIYFIHAIDEIALNEVIRGDLIQFGGVVGLLRLLKTLFKFDHGVFGMPLVTKAMKTLVTPLLKFKTVLELRVGLRYILDSGKRIMQEVVSLILLR